MTWFVIVAIALGCAVWYLFTRRNEATDTLERMEARLNLLEFEIQRLRDGQKAAEPQPAPVPQAVELPPEPRPRATPPPIPPILTQEPQPQPEPVTAAPPNARQPRCTRFRRQ